MQIKTEVLNNPAAKKKAMIGAAVVVALATSFYFSNGGSITKLIATAKHPFNTEARQVYLEMGYSNPALAKQLKEGRANLQKGITTPSYVNIGMWGKKDQEVDEFKVTQNVTGSDVDVRNRLDVDAKKVTIKATLVGEDGCADLYIRHAQGDAKICLAQDEEIVIPVTKSKELLEREAKQAKQEAEWKAKQEQWKREREERMRQYQSGNASKTAKRPQAVYQSQGFTLGGF